MPVHPPLGLAVGKPNCCDKSRGEKCVSSRFVYVSKTPGPYVLLDSKDGAVVRALASHQCGPGLIPARCHLWVEFAFILSLP